MTDLIGGALLTIGGGMQLAYALQLLRGRPTGRTDLPELAVAYPVRDDVPADMIELLAPIS